MGTHSLTAVELEKFFFDFRGRGSEFYQEYLGELTNRETCITLGYNVRTKANSGVAVRIRKNGRIRASRVQLMCSNLEKNPSEMLAKYEPDVLLFRGGIFEEIDERVKNAVYKKFCDAP